MTKPKCQKSAVVKAIAPTSNKSSRKANPSALKSKRRSRAPKRDSRRTNKEPTGSTTSIIFAKDGDTGNQGAGQCRGQEAFIRSATWGFITVSIDFKKALDVLRATGLMGRVLDAVSAMREHF